MDMIYEGADLVTRAYETQLLWNPKLNVESQSDTLVREFHDQIQVILGVQNCNIRTHLIQNKQRGRIRQERCIQGCR